MIHGPTNGLTCYRSSRRPSQGTSHGRQFIPWKSHEAFRGPSSIPTVVLPIGRPIGHPMRYPMRWVTYCGRIHGTFLGAVYYHWDLGFYHGVIYGTRGISYGGVLRVVYFSMGCPMRCSMHSLRNADATLTRNTKARTVTGRG